MTLWGVILLACAATYFTKLAGYAVPARWLHNPRMARGAGAITVALLSALTVMNTFVSGTDLVLDARLAALAVEALALWLRLPFLLVVVLGAVRWWGERVLRFCVGHMGCCRPIADVPADQPNGRIRLEAGIQSFASTVASDPTESTGNRQRCLECFS